MASPAGSLDTLRRELLNPDGVVIDLTTGEYDMLLALVEAPQRVLTRDQLLDMSRNRVATGFDRSIDVQVSRLRRKLGSDEGESMIKTIRGQAICLFRPSPDYESGCPNMRLIPDTIAGRTIVALLLGVVIFHLASIWAYQIGVNSEVDLTNEGRMADRLATIANAIAQLPPDERDAMAHSLSGGPIEVHWSSTPLSVRGGLDDEAAANLRNLLSAAASGFGGVDFIVGAPAPLKGEHADAHLVLASIKLATGGWVNYSVTKIAGHHTSLSGVVVSTSLMAVGVIAVLIGVVRTITGPLQNCATAVERLYRDPEPKPLAVRGPREVRALATAFNALEQRVKRLVDDRTLTLAAISHDLKSPLARAQLRVEEIPDSDLRRQFEADFAEMVAMIDSSLDFLKSDQDGERVRDLDVSAILQSICDDLSDMGRPARLVTKGKTILRGRRLALKRAFFNLVDNAVKYGASADIEVSGGPDAITVVVTDKGLGIPAGQREAVFRPFFRLEGSRSRETGGVGLGLTVARTVIRSHGGDIELHDGSDGGLQVRVILPILSDRSGEHSVIFGQNRSGADHRPSPPSLNEIFRPRPATP